MSGTTCYSPTAHVFGQLKFRRSTLSRENTKMWSVHLGSWTRKHTATGALIRSLGRSVSLPVGCSAGGGGQSLQGKWGRRKRRVTPTHAHAYITLSYLLHNLPYSRHGSNTSHSHTHVPVNPHLIPCRVGVNLSLHLHSSGDNDIISTH